MAQIPFQSVQPALLDFASQSFLRSVLSTEDDHSRDNVWVYDRGDPYSDPTLYQRRSEHPRPSRLYIGYTHAPLLTL